MQQIPGRLTQPMGFILLPGFALMSYASATEPLRAANLLAGGVLYDIVTLSPGGAPVRSSSGALIACEPLGQGAQALHTVFVCAGGHPGEWHYPQVHAALRTMARNGVRVGGISGGPYLLAAAGLLDGRDFTVHWEHAPALIEAFPHLAPRQARFVLDGNRITCGGGVAPLDMMHALIAERMGADFARRVSDWYLHTAVAEPAAPQRASAAERFGVHHPALLDILAKMETTIEQPLGRRPMAAFAGISPRHLDRLFAGHLGRSFLETYRNIRLRHARRLLQQSPLSIAEIAYATGFSSAAHFSTAYRRLFGHPPRREREKFS
ncbi:MAG: GlxA family transcriptional regulator [Pseudochelatococcus sp.]|jgi:transcriptional regulator GlxA family with amidase domain|uniref:GlxA family transcriptional regulator n=1 Tax=Pseudochelatococcus sp. TaxID=2020869 RepID=UPI003D8C9BEE